MRRRKFRHEILPSYNHMEDPQLRLGERIGMLVNRTD